MRNLGSILPDLDEAALEESALRPSDDSLLLSRVIPMAITVYQLGVRALEGDFLTLTPIAVGLL